MSVSWGVAGRYICAVHLSRYVNLCGSYEVTQDSGYGWGNGGAGEGEEVGQRPSSVSRFIAQTISPACS